MSQWVAYNAGDVIPEDYYVAGEMPPSESPAIRIINPQDSPGAVNYALNDYNFEIKPGDHQDLTDDRQWVIGFDRGGNFGDAEYTLQPGDYTFGPSDHGWELYHNTADEIPAPGPTPDSGPTSPPPAPSAGS